MEKPPVSIKNNLYDEFFNGIKVDSQGCWIWQGTQATGGYGILSRQGHKILTHRYSWLVHKGPIPKGLSVCHDCPEKDNPLCVNPDHLFLGTQATNNRDRWKKDKLRYKREGILNKNKRQPYTDYSKWISVIKVAEDKNVSLSRLIRMCKIGNIEAKSFLGRGYLINPVSLKDLK